MTPFAASLMSLDSSGFTCAAAPAPVGQRMTINAGFSEPAAFGRSYGRSRGRGSLPFGRRSAECNR